VLHGTRATLDPMANLTIVIDETVLKKARIRALEEGTSVNAVVRQYLESYSGADPGQRANVDEILNLSKKSRSRKGSKRWTRDDLHNRGL
jgi:plasmid stability protein